MSSISYRYKRITKQLNKDFWSSDSETAHSLYVGSYGRDTAASGVSDLDVAFRLPSDLYYTYDAYTSNGQSALLQAVRNSIQNTYSITSIGADGQVVVVAFDDGITFEILPVFDNKSGSYTFADTNGGGSWKTCDPRAEMAAFSSRNSATNGNLKAICRMARIWKRRHGVRMSGMLIDTLAYQFIETWAHRDKSYMYHDWLTRDFLFYLSEIDTKQLYWRAPGSASFVWKDGNFQIQADASFEVALEAISHESNDRPASARLKWREVFGSIYP